MLTARFFALITTLSVAILAGGCTTLPSGGFDAQHVPVPSASNSICSAQRRTNAAWSAPKRIAIREDDSTYIQKIQAASFNDGSYVMGYASAPLGKDLGQQTFIRVLPNVGAGEPLINTNLLTLPSRDLFALDSKSRVVSFRGDASQVSHEFYGMAQAPITSARYESSNQWSDPQTVSPAVMSVSSLYESKVASNGAGDMFLALRVDNELWVNRYSASDGWLGAEKIFERTATKFVTSFKLALNHRGDLVVVYDTTNPQVFDGTHSILTREWTTEKGWSAERAITQKYTVSAQAAAINDDKRVSVVLVPDTGGMRDFTFVQYTAGDTAEIGPSTYALNGSLTSIEANNDLGADPRIVGVNEYGTWACMTRNCNAVLLSRTGLANATSTNLTLRGTHDGGMVAVWQQQALAGDQSIYAAIYTPDGNWQPAVLLEGLNGASGPPAVAVDCAGNVVVVWEQHVSSNGVWEIYKVDYR